MANIAVWLLAIAWPVAKKVLLMLGIGVLTYEGVTLLTNSVISSAQASWGGITGSTLAILSLGGGPEALGIIAGGLTARATLVAVGKIGRIAA